MASKYAFILTGDFASCSEIVREELHPFYGDKLGMKATFKIGANINKLVEAVNEDDHDVCFIYILNGGSVLDLVGKLMEWIDNPPTIKIFEVSSCSGGLCYTVIDPLNGYEEWLKNQD